VTLASALHAHAHYRADLVYKDGKTKSFQEQRASITRCLVCTRTASPELTSGSVAIHSDVTYELQPPGLTTFFILSIPGKGTSGGDTVFVVRAVLFGSGDGR
jgi:sulfonate dioxygenase